MKHLLLLLLFIASVFCVADDDVTEMEDAPNISFCEGLCLQAVPNGNDRALLIKPRSENQKEQSEKDERNLEKCKDKCSDIYAPDSENEKLLEELKKLAYEK